MMVLEYGSDVIIIDAGSMFPMKKCFAWIWSSPISPTCQTRSRTCVASFISHGTRTTSAAYRIFSRHSIFRPVWHAPERRA